MCITHFLFLQYANGAEPPFMSLNLVSRLCRVTSAYSFAALLMLKTDFAASLGNRWQFGDARSSLKMSSATRTVHGTDFQSFGGPIAKHKSLRITSKSSSGGRTRVM